MGSTWGNAIKISIFGESHGAGIGVVIDGFPSGVAYDEAFVLREMERRAPGRNRQSTARKEADRPEIQSGIYNGKTTGTPIAMPAATAMAMPEDSMVRTFVTPASAKSRPISCPIFASRAVSICWFRKLPTFRICPGSTLPSVRIFSSIKRIRSILSSKKQTGRRSRLPERIVQKKKQRLSEKAVRDFFTNSRG